LAVVFLKLSDPVEVQRIIVVIRIDDKTAEMTRFSWSEVVYEGRKRPHLARAKLG